MRLLVIGLGSIGTRHTENLLKLGQEIWIYDKDLMRLETVSKKLNLKVYDFKSKHLDFAGWIICTPPNYHVPFAFEALEHGANCFIEKPISDNLDRLDELISSYEKANLTLMVGYQLRYNQGLLEIHRIIETKELGKLLSIRAEYGNYLPNWHKDEDYSKLYTARRNEGGGIILDSSHEIDYVAWLVNSPVIEVKSMHTKVSDLEIDVEDTADILLSFDNNVIANIHLDMTDKFYKRSCTVVFENGDVYWTPESLVIKGNKPRIQMYKSDDEYLLEMKEFLNCISNKSKPAVDGKCATETLKICLQALNKSVILV